MTDHIRIRPSGNTYIMDGKVVTEAEYRARYPLPKQGRPAQKKRHGNWPILSDAAGVLPSQTGEAAALASSLGVPTQFTKDGRAVLRSPQHRREFLKAHSMRDRNCYG